MVTSANIRNPMKYLWNCLFFIPFLSGLIAVLGAMAPPPDKPNIILVFVDDLGYNDLTEFHLPNIQGLYQNGLTFSNFQTTPVCTPSRVALLTGKYPQNFGKPLENALLFTDVNIGLPCQTKTIFEHLQEQGYQTGMFGKWHLGLQESFSPSKHGFNQWIGCMGSNIDYHNKINTRGEYDWFKNDVPLQEEGYVTDLIAKHTIDFMRDNKNSPFAIYLPFTSPHGPFQGPNDPAYRILGGGPDDWTEPEANINSYRAMVESLDEAIGRVLNEIEQLGLQENTLVFFVSDNGAASKVLERKALSRGCA